MAGLSLRSVTKTYGRVRALDDVSLEARDGELLVLVGPSGSGKSTALRTVAGLEGIDAGTILIGERDVTRVPPSRRNVAMVFQSYALFPHLSVFDNLAFGPGARGEDRAGTKRRIGVVADALGLDGLLHRKPSQLSGGERQRVALGRAMVREPAVFLMDEPLSNLDAQLRTQTRSEIVRLQARLGTTTVYVTHDQVEALTMGHRVGVLDGGRLQQIGSPAEVYDRPANLFVARFIGSPPMNLFDARRTSDDRLDWGGGSIEAPLGAPADVILGVRPEHVHVVGSRWSKGMRKRDPFAARVDLVELAGDQAFLELEVNGARVVARVEPSMHPSPGDLVEAWFDHRRLHLFDPTRGERHR